MNLLSNKDVRPENWNEHSVQTAIDRLFDDRKYFLLIFFQTLTKCRKIGLGIGRFGAFR